MKLQNIVLSKLISKIDSRMGLWIGFGLASIVCILVSLPKTESKPPTSPIPGIDTFIPRDHALFPIQPLNQTQLEGLMQDRAVVDLYLPGQKEPVARSVRLLRAPFDKNQFAALAPLSERHIFIREDNSFVVVIRNPEERQLVKAKPRRRIVVEGDSL